CDVQGCRRQLRKMLGSGGPVRIEGSRCGGVEVHRRLCRVAEIEWHSEYASQPELANDLHVVVPSGLGADVGDLDQTVTRLCLQAGTLVEPCLHLVDLPR